MFDLRENMVIIDGRIRTVDILYCRKGKGDTFNIAFKGTPHKNFSYGCDRVVWITNPIVYNVKQCKVLHNNRELLNVVHLNAFIHGFSRYWYVEFANGSSKSFSDDEIRVEQSCLDAAKAKHVFEYMKGVAKINALRADDSEKSLLSIQYDKVSFIHSVSAAACFLNPDRYPVGKFPVDNLIYPFGANSSQFKAVRAAFENQISVIQGPPGTGKTQTILNILANIILQKKTALIVSNNNSAILNVVEKLEKYDLDFIAAVLGSKQNKELFIETQSSKLIPSDINKWDSKAARKASFLKQVDTQANNLLDVFKKQERLACAIQELDALRIEKEHFEQEVAYNEDYALRGKWKSAKLVRLWQELENMQEKNLSSNIFSFLTKPIYTYWVNLKLKTLFKGVKERIKVNDLEPFITYIQHKFYEVKELELTKEIQTLRKILDKCDAKTLLATLQHDSMSCLRNSLFNRYGGNHIRPIYSLDTIDKSLVDEYPIILSTTFSARSNFGDKVIFDYVIMDEASQISSETGLLALTCAKNAVIVGDTMQLPNVITSEDKQKMQKVAKECQVDTKYDCSQHSFLQSVCNVLPNVTQTLLREHYRCHPKIINFCNQKYYGGKLIIMTSDNGEDHVVSAVRIVKGNHSRGNFNQREVDVISQEVLPEMDVPNVETGIIAPYNDQVDLIKKSVSADIDVATVHKFQGREKDAIVMSMVDDVVTAFSDDSNLFNVAISRAKKKFCLVVSSCQQPENSNVQHFLEYLKYNNCTISDSNVHSIFDMLYAQYSAERLAYLSKYKKISEYDSENLAYSMLMELIEENQSFGHIGIVCHPMMRRIIRNVSLLPLSYKSYALHPNTHVDFLLYNRVGKKPIVAIEVDGYSFHKSGTKQSHRDSMKDEILKIYGIPLLRLSTIGSGEKKLIEEKLMSL